VQFHQDKRVFAIEARDFLQPCACHGQRHLGIKASTTGSGR
jgi:hypothetical protein